jgi:hypothetical protein
MFSFVVVHMDVRDRIHHSLIYDMSRMSPSACGFNIMHFVLNIKCDL